MDLLSVKSVNYQNTIGSSSTQCESPAYVIPEMKNEQLEHCKKEMSLMAETIESLKKEVSELKDDKILNSLKVNELEQQVTDQFEVIHEQAAFIEELNQNKEELTKQVETLDASLKQFMETKCMENTEFMQNLAVKKIKSQLKDNSKLGNLKLNLDTVCNDDSAACITVSSQSISDRSTPMYDNRFSFGSEVRNDLIKLTNQIMEINGQPKMLPRTTTSRLNSKNLVLCAFTSQISDRNDDNKNCKSDRSMPFTPCKEQESVLDTTVYNNWKDNRINRAKPQTNREDISSTNAGRGIHGIDFPKTLREQPQDFQDLPSQISTYRNEMDSVYGVSSSYPSTIVERHDKARNQKMKSYFTQIYLQQFLRQQNK